MCDFLNAIELTDEQAERIEQETNRWKTIVPARSWCTQESCKNRAAIDAIVFRVQNYKEKYFDIEGLSGKAGNCYHVGSNKIRRKDGLPISEQDMYVARLFNCGQVNRIKGQVGDMFIMHEWECDSSD